METLYLSMPWGKMAYYCRGNPASPDSMLFLHGTGCDSSDWQEILSLMPPEPLMVALDFRGHGNSSVPGAPFTLADLASDAVALAVRLNLRNPVLAGHSLGGMVALAAAAKGFRPGALVLVEGWTNLDKASRAFREPRFFGRLGPELKTLIEQKHKKTVSGFKPVVWEHFWQSVRAFDALDFLESAPLPIFEIYGSLGRIKTTRRDLAIPSRPNIELSWLDGAGHYLPLEKPVELAGICKRALKQCSGG